MRSPWRCVGAVSILLFVAASACGSRSGLDVPPIDLDAGVFLFDAPVDSPPREIDAPFIVDAPFVDAPFVDAPIVDAPIVDAPAVDAPILADGPLQCCGDEQNTDFPPDDNCHGNTVAWQYIPSCDFILARIEIHRSGGGTVSLLDSDGARPGVTLFTGLLPSSPSSAWVGANVDHPLPLRAGHIYWIEESPGICSIATQGIPYTYYGNLGTGWEGPFQGHPWTSRVIGACLD